MAAILLWTNPDGYLCVVVPAPAGQLPGESQADWLARVAATSIPAGTSYRTADTADLPTDYADRGAWADNGANVYVDQTRLASLASTLLSQQRGDAKDWLANRRDALLKLVRAEALVAMDEINLLRQWVTDFQSAVAAASSLSDLKTRVANLSNLPQRTSSQLISAVSSRIDGGGAD